MPTQILAAGTTAATSTTVTVTAGSAVSVGFFRDDEGPIEADAKGEIFREDPDGNMNSTGFEISGINPNFNLVGAGIYEVRRAAGLSYATGIQSD